MPLMPCSALKYNGDQGVDDAHHEADRQAHEHGQPEVSGFERRPVSEERAQQHHAVDAQVEHAAALADRLAEGGEEIGRRQANTGREGGHQDGDGEELAHVVAASGSLGAGPEAPVVLPNPSGRRPSR